MDAFSETKMIKGPPAFRSLHGDAACAGRVVCGFRPATRHAAIELGLREDLQRSNAILRAWDSAPGGMGDVC